MNPACQNSLYHSERGYALLLAMGVLLMVTLCLTITERTLSESLAESRRAAGKVQADWACFGAANQAAWQQPDSLVMYTYFGTRVQVTVHDPPLALVEELLEVSGPAGQASSEADAPIRMYCAVAATTAFDTPVEATWYFVVRDSERPQIWASWPGLERNQPYY